MRRAIAAGAMTLPLLLAPVANGQTTNEDLLREIQELKKGQQELRQQLSALQQQLRGRGAPSGPDVAGKQFELGSNPVKGDPAARLTLIEFTDYQ